MLLWLTLACETGATDSAGSVSPDVTLHAAPAFDPGSDTPLTWTVTGDDAEPGAAGTIVDSAGAVVRKRVASAAGWDGRTDDGALAPTGAYTLRVGAGESAPSHPFQLVRAGLTAAWAEDDGGTPATRVALYWAQKRHIQDVAAAFSQVGGIDAADGTATALPALGDDLTYPTEGTTEPLAYPYDSRPIVTVQLGAESAWGPPNLDAVPLDVAAAGWSVLEGSPATDGGTVTLQRDAPLGSTVGVTEEVLTLEVTTTDDEGVVWPVQSMQVPLRVYRLLDTPTWDAEGERYSPWVAAVDPALRALEGTLPTRDAVLDALVRWVFEDEGLEYDTRYGASAYTVYQGNDWERANFNMGAYLARKYGVVVNCTDCAGIMVGYGNMLGARVEYAIIGMNFDLNYILAIGGDEFTHCPFGGSGCGFSYHAVSVSSESDLIWDATLALDGDDDPGAAPHEELLVQAIDADEYLERLAKTRTDYIAQAQGGLQ